VTPTIQRVHVQGAPDRPARAPVPAPSSIDPSKDAMVRSVDLVFALRRHLAEKKDKPSASLPEVRQLLHELAALYQTRSVRFHGLTPASLTRDSVIFHHVNVLVLSLAFGAELGLSRQRLDDLAEFAFFSDVGLYDLPEETLTQAGELTAEDKRALLQARRTSGWFPFSRKGEAPAAVDWACVVVEHGLDWGAKDAAGAVTERTEIGLLGTIVSLAKMYDALTSKRSFRPALAPEAAIDTLVHKVGHRFRPELLPLFVRMVKREFVKALPRR
jgi:response regulator RpfG family c-di-GMP phosphodiesterase